MEKENKQAKKDVPGKKELKKQLASKMEAALPELRELLGEKKFINRLNKAAKLLLEGVHKQDISEKKSQPAAKTATKKAANKQAAPKAAKAKK